MHIFAFILQSLADIFLSDSIMINLHVIKKGLIFLTAPYYILEICEAEYALYT